MRHAEELAKDDGLAELWALHSDRLARGDGRSARHAVEIALWALKQDGAEIHVSVEPQDGSMQKLGDSRARTTGV